MDGSWSVICALYCDYQDSVVLSYPDMLMMRSLVAQTIRAFHSCLFDSLSLSFLIFNIIKWYVLDTSLYLQQGWNDFRDVIELFFDDVDRCLYIFLWNWQCWEMKKKCSSKRYLKKGRRVYIQIDFVFINNVQTPSIWRQSKRRKKETMQRIHLFVLCTRKMRKGKIVIFFFTLNTCFSFFSSFVFHNSHTYTELLSFISECGCMKKGSKAFFLRLHFFLFLNVPYNLLLESANKSLSLYV